MLRLQFDSCVIKSDTIEFNFNFVDGKDTIRASQLKDFVHLKNGIGYNAKTKEKLYLKSLYNYAVKDKGKTSRFENPLQPEVNKYIESNWNTLDPCFKILVEKKRSPNKKQRK